MADQYRFGDYQRESTATHDGISFDDLIDLRPKLEKDAEGNVIPYQAPPVRLTTDETFRLLRPYVSVRFMEQIKAVVPLGVYLALFQILFLQQVVEDSWVITGGLFAVIAGLMFFMEGLKLGLMPFGTIIGRNLPRNSPLPVVLFVTLLLGIGVTFAEPAIGALQTAGQNLSVERAPYLYAVPELLVYGTGPGGGFKCGPRGRNRNLAVSLQLEPETSDLRDTGAVIVVDSIRRG